MVDYYKKECIGKAGTDHVSEFQLLPSYWDMFDCFGIQDKIYR